MRNEFDEEEKYKLYRTVKEILHPTISKKNISNYKIILGENLIPVRVFYPKKVSNIKDVIIFIHGNSKITNSTGNYSEISKIFSSTLDRLVISIDYNDTISLDILYSDIYDTFKFIHKSLIESDIIDNNITLIGDSTGASIALSMVKKMNENNINIGNLILFYPILSGEYFGKAKYKSFDNNALDYNLIEKLKKYYKDKLQPKDYKSPVIFHLNDKDEVSYPKTLLLYGNVDPLMDEAKELALKKNISLKIVDFANHGFLNSKDKETIKEYSNVLKDFIETKNNDKE